MRLILATGSKQRHNIFNMLGLKYEVIKSTKDEFSNETEPNLYVMELSKNKAIDVSTMIDSKAIIVAADTIIYSGNKIYEKPKSKEEAFLNIKSMINNKNYAVTGITIYDLYKDKIFSFSSEVEVYLRNVSDEEIKWYVNNEKNIYGSCGFCPIGKGALFIDRINGDYNTLFGMSPSLLFEKFKELGYDVTDFSFDC